MFGLRSGNALRILGPEHNKLPLRPRYWSIAMMAVPARMRLCARAKTPGWGD